MKKLIAFLCLISMLFPLCACSSGLSAGETLPTLTETEGKQTEEAKETGPITYPEGFSVGYARADVTTVPLSIFESVGETAHDPLQLTVTALCDGENVAVVMSLDAAGVTYEFTEKSMDLLEKEFGIPSSAVILNATHTHSAHTAGSTSDSSLRFTANFYKKLVIAVEEALRDLTPAKAFAGVSHTDGITFVRRYLMPDGSYQTNPTATVLAHETEADNELRTLRFQREGKKDVLMVNYQTHYGGATSKYPNQISADFIHPYRIRAEKDLNCHFAYQSGAGGNLNFNSSIEGERKYGDFVAAIDGFMIATKDAIAKEEAIATGKIVAKGEFYNAKVIQDSPERIQHAQEVAFLSHDASAQSILISKYGFASKREANAVIARAEFGETKELLLTAITCGDIAFTGFPYEMFDTNGQEVRAASPYKMTFVCSLTNGSYGYIPSALAYPHGGYEVYSTRFVEGTGEELVADMLRILNSCKASS